jgi:hypothetical protein
MSTRKENMTNKQCKGCYKFKLLNLFYKVKNNKDGHNGKCIECIKKYNKYQRDHNPNFIKSQRKSDRKRLEKMKNGEAPHRVEAMLIRKRNNNTLRRLSQGLHKGRNDTFLRLFGCSKKVFIARFERYFEKNPGMGWHNYGAWNMDHIKPMKYFKLDTIESVKQCNHYTNLRPEWAVFNMQRGAKYDENQVAQ